MKKLCVLLAVVMVFAVCAAAFADKEERYTREESARRGIKLLSVAEAKAIAAKQIGKNNITYNEVELKEKSEDYPNAENFRPVYKIECRAGRDEYDVVVDAVTGQVLKFKLDN